MKWDALITTLQTRLAGAEPEALWTISNSAENDYSLYPSGTRMSLTEFAEVLQVHLNGGPSMNRWEIKASELGAHALMMTYLGSSLFLQHKFRLDVSGAGFSFGPLMGSWDTEGFVKRLNKRNTFFWLDRKCVTFSLLGRVVPGGPIYCRVYRIVCDIPSRTTWVEVLCNF